MLYTLIILFLCRCQTYEGGFSGYPGLEAHGGYTFCGIAALVLLNSVHLCDMKALLVSEIASLRFEFSNDHLIEHFVYLFSLRDGA